MNASVFCVWCNLELDFGISITFTMAGNEFDDEIRNEIIPNLPGDGKVPLLCLNIETCMNFRHSATKMVPLSTRRSSRNNH